MEVKEYVVTPDVATKWLEGNTHNRALRESVVAKYARDMKAGRWRLTHQAIAFDGNGTLLDGQHRLWAVIESKTTCRFIVARGCDPKTLAVIDAQEGRTHVDHLKLGYGENASRLQVAIAKRLMRGKIGNSVSSAEVYETLLAHRPAIECAVRACSRQVRNVTVVPVLTVLARAYYHTNANATGILNRIGEVLTEGKIERGEETLLTLRNWLLTKAPAHGSGGATLVYQKTERALHAFLNAQTLVGKLYAATQELFPMPGERLTTSVVGSKTVTVAAKGKKKISARQKTFAEKHAPAAVRAKRTAA